ncbi:hypothetical protein ALT_7383 [Aspergillus lentulus]|uniref:Nephrocystin 3-like N-terminal domain-containing protein n=1 Tax=Aspergillus lentulus TaxID=293939 RepID=A0AAN4PPY2_ASPLE|nr:hypothetical protein ALT_7383 [Aspergillus lentulus]
MITLSHFPRHLCTPPRISSMPVHATMGSFRALCCSKSDRKNNDQPTPPKPSTQPRPEKQTQKPPANVKVDTSSTDVTQEKPGPRDLWKEAYEGLDPECKKYVARNDSSATDAINGVIQQTTARYEEWKKDGLRIARKDGDEINLRDSAEKIINAAMKANNLISTFVSFDPTGHASSAWTVIAFGMSIVQNTLDRRDAIFAASEYLAQKLAFYSLIDANYRNQGVGSDHELDEALRSVYSAILSFAAEVRKAQDENVASRTAQSVFALTEQPLSQLKDAINEKGASAQEWAHLAANLGDRKVAAAHLATIKSVECKVLSADSPHSRDEYLLKRELQKKRIGDTGNWLLESKDYLEWKYNSGSLLWLPGISGCGKSVLCSTVIRDIEQECQLDDAKYLAYWYFQFGDEKTQSVDSMTRSLIRQLSRSPLLPSVVKIWNEHRLKGSEPDSQAISNLLDDVVSSIPGNVYLIFDALDECPVNAYSKERRSLLSLLTGLLERYRSKVHILATSRAEQDIKEKLEVFCKIDLEARLADDVKTFVTTSIAQPPLKRLNENIKGLIQEKLLSSKERRFRWAELQIAEIEKCRREKDIEVALDTIPQTLEASYLKILNALEPRDVPLARDILMTICTSPIALDLKMVAAIVGLDFPDSILEICTTSLISEFDGKIRVAHFSVQEFLIVDGSNQHQHECQFSTMDGHRFLATSTVDYLLEQNNLLTKEELGKLPYFEYAAREWNTIVAAVGENSPVRSDLQPKINRLFTEPNVYINWARYWTDGFVFRNYEGAELVERCDRPIQLASRFGIAQTVEELMNQGADAEAIYDESGSRALRSAAHQGHKRVVEILLDRGADINALSGVFASTALGEASREGHEDIVLMLLDRGADVNIVGRRKYGSALADATKNGQYRIMRLLLDNGATVASRNDDGYGALVAAARSDDKQGLRILLDHIEDIDAEGTEYRSALHCTARDGNAEAMRLLLDRATDVNGPNVRGRPDKGPLIQVAASSGAEEAVRVLLDRGADVNAHDPGEATALEAASIEGHENIVELLLKHGADANIQDPNEEEGALQLASREGHASIVQLLVDHGADIEVQGAFTSPLRLAAMRGHEKVVQILLERGASVNARKGETGGAAIHGASANGHDGVVRILLDHGADPSMVGGKIALPALTHGVFKGDKDVVQLLLDWGVDINAPGGNGLTALACAADKGREEILEILLDHGADVNANGECSTALQHAASKGHEKMVQILLDRGANVNLRGGDLDTAVKEASSNGHEGIVRLLLDRGAEPIAT